MPREGWDGSECYDDSGEPEGPSGIPWRGSNRLFTRGAERDGAWVALAGELEALGVNLVVTEQAVDTTTPAGRLLFTVLGAIAAFERDLIVDRVRAGIARARAQGKHLGRPRTHHVDVSRARKLRAEGLSLRATARQLGIHPTILSRALGNGRVA
jgi:DNA invertase Pin-like site-specific DNA recombinase